MKESIVITGSGIVSSIGLDKQETLSSLLAGKSGVRPVRYLQTIHREFPVGEVPLSDEEMKSRLGINAEPTTRTVLMGMLALDEALGEACLLGSDGRRAILVSGTTVGGMDKSEQFFSDYLQNDSRNDYIATHGLAVAIDYLQRLGLDNIHRHEKNLTDYALEKLKNLDEMEVFGSNQDAIISFNMTGIHHLDAGTLLDRLGIAVRTGHHCAQPLMDRLGVSGTVRASFGLYNTRNDVDRLLAALHQVRRMF